jgi:transcriptional regulator with XRE-family HTH domain
MIGSEIRKARRARGVTLASMAESIGCTPQALSRIELGRPTTTTLVERFAAAVGLEIIAVPSKGGKR